MSKIEQCLKLNKGINDMNNNQDLDYIINDNEEDLKFLRAMDYQVHQEIQKLKGIEEIYSSIPFNVLLI